MKISNLSEKLAILGVYSLLVVSALGTFIGTYSWFEYRERASLTFNGTSLSDSLEIDVGLRSAVDLPDFETYGLEQDVNDSHIYWSETGLSWGTLDYFLRANGYATNKLVPVSSGSYATGEQIDLKARPTENKTALNPANKLEYCYIPLVFKAVNNISTLSNYDIILQNVKLRTDSLSTKAFRIHFDGSNQEKFLFSPSDEEGGFNNVGGVIDLGNDGCFDYSSVTNKEIFYGEADGEVFYNDTPSPHEDILPEEERNVFNASHKEGVYAVDFTKTKCKTSTYLGKNEVIRNNKIICSGTDLEYATCNMSLYFEGWSEYITESISENSKFDLTLNFSLANDM